MIKIFQIYFQKDQVHHLDQGFTPYFNTSCDVALREWPVIRSGPMLMSDDLKKDPNAIWGFVSWKWKQKTLLSSKCILDCIKNKPDYDVWFMEPQYSKPIYFNPWTQGDLCHKDISNLAQTVFQKMGWDMPKLRELQMPFCWYNFYAGNAHFWAKYFNMMDLFIETAKNDPELNRRVFEESAQYGLDATIPYFIFLVERLFPTLIATDTSIRSYAMPYHHPAFNV
jgi:hypothetical protein